MRKITKIQVNLPMFTPAYWVGKEVGWDSNENDERIIKKIIENSIDDGKDYIHIIEIHTDEGIAKEIINTPMSITYGDGS